jgi:predicted metal-binding protein
MQYKKQTAENFNYKKKNLKNKEDENIFKFQECCDIPNECRYTKQENCSFILIRGAAIKIDL